MAVSTKIIRQRIRSITNTKKITKAMELVSAAKMRKAVRNTLASRSYASTAWGLVVRLSEKTNYVHPFFSRQDYQYSSSEGAVATESRSSRQVRTGKVAVVLISSNRGLCGAFNANIARKALGIVGSPSTQRTRVGLGAGRAPLTVEFLTLGKKSRDIIRRTGAMITADFEKPDVTTSVTEISSLAHLVIDECTKGTYDRVYLAYTDFVSSLRQEAVVKQLLPVEAVDARVPLVSTRGTLAESYEYLFEPSPETLLNDLLPRLITLQIYQAVLESDASEHSARMLAMRNATDAAGDMISDLTLFYNQARQAGITQEIAEIAGGKAALEG